MADGVRKEANTSAGHSELAKSERRGSSSSSPEMEKSGPRKLTNGVFSMAIAVAQNGSADLVEQRSSTTPSTAKDVNASYRSSYNGFASVAPTSN